MKKLILVMGLLSPLVISACASNTTSQQGLKKSPCACVYKPIPSADFKNSDPFINQASKIQGNSV